ncbi:MAG: glycosyltransferase family 4 protein [Rubellimicrobium sp.]|nr:glycosyltransferase family 4 protein [Rubellimicrobium sp.]
MARISVLYHHFPHYRAPVMRALVRQGRHDYHFFGGLEDHDGIRAFRGDETVTVHPVTFVQGPGRRVDIRDFDRALSGGFEATIILGNMRMPGVWRAVRQARRNGLATAFWAHGWLRRESWPRRLLRNRFFAQADRVLLYGARAQAIAAQSGFAEGRTAVIWNSLDWDRQSALFHRHAATARRELRAALGMPQDMPVVATISRVTPACRYDWLVAALARMRQRGTAAAIWMIGDGPARPALEAMARAAGVPLLAQGAQYDEEAIARQIMAADLVASPGKVGLTAMHALAYGTPVVTHDDLDRQMPEVEAVIEGVSGAFFRHGDIADLAGAITRLLPRAGADPGARRAACRAALEGRFTPADQVRLIDAAMDGILHAHQCQQA